MIQAQRVYDKDFAPTDLRVLTMRHWPRGVFIEALRPNGQPGHCIDVYMADAAPSRALLADYRARRVTWEQLTERYISEQAALTSCSYILYHDRLRDHAARKQAGASPVEWLRREAQNCVVTVLCWEDTTQPNVHCHRDILVRLARDGFPS